MKKELFIDKTSTSSSPIYSLPQPILSFPLPFNLVTFVKVTNVSQIQGIFISFISLSVLRFSQLNYSLWITFLSWLSSCHIPMFALFISFLTSPASIIWSPFLTYQNVLWYSMKSTLVSYTLQLCWPAIAVQQTNTKFHWHAILKFVSYVSVDWLEWLCWSWLGFFRHPWTWAWME